MDHTETNNIMNPEYMKTVVKAIVRTVFITINNFYCIPAHILWLLVLQPLRWMSENAYWKVEGMFFRWLLSMVAMWSYSAGYDIIECGDDISDIQKKRALILFNHQSTSDVPLIMAALNSKKGILDNIMWIMDKQFKLTNFGIVSVGHGDFFIQAGKEHRESSLVDLRNHMKNFYMPRDRKWLVLFPEGGFLCKRKQTSQQYAKKNNLPHLENVTLPRIGALKVILDEASAVVNNSSSSVDSGIEYVIDVTVAYPKGDPLDICSIFTGWRQPCDTVFHYRKFSVSEIPRDETNLTKWLYERYIEKEKILKNYYDTGNFADLSTDNQQDPKSYLPAVQGTKVSHDPLEFLVRHLFYLVSSYIWIRLFLLFIYGISNIL